MPDKKRIRTRKCAACSSMTSCSGEVSVQVMVGLLSVSPRCRICRVVASARSESAVTVTLATSVAGLHRSLEKMATGWRKQRTSGRSPP